MCRRAVVGGVEHLEVQRVAEIAEECGISVREAARRLILNTGIAAIEGTSLEESVLMHGVISMQQEETRDLFERYLGEDFGGSLN
jgi:hypothetical protein